MSGLSASDVQRLARKAIFEHGAITASDVPLVMRAKYDLLNRQGILRYEHDTAHFADVGVQGCGKSLAARASADIFNVPLLQLDCAALFNKYVGESERNLRESLAPADLLTPCVLWIDEIEKGFASGESDGGATRRVLGTFLTWMAEKKTCVFVVATANDISVVAALYSANAAHKPPDAQILRAEIAATRPLAVVMAEKVQALREWASARTVPAD
jgi:hypothetical protein